MIEVKNLWKRYHNHHGSDWVLRDINLTIPKGISVGLIGGNGAGKSTLLRLIAGMDTPERGSVTRHSRVSWPVGLSGGMQGNMTGRQNTKFVARAFGSSPKEMHRIIDFVQDFAEIGDAFDEPVRTYSSGMRSRLSFGLSLAFDFDVYISDEATAVGDRAFKAKAKALFEERVGKSSLIMVSHSEGILRDLCQAGVYLRGHCAYWYEDVNEAIAAYHADCSKDEMLPDSEIFTRNPDKDELSKAQYKSAIKDRKNLKQLIAGLRTVIQAAKQHQWPRDEISLLQTYTDAFTKQNKAINKAIQGSSEGQLATARNNLKQYKNAVDALSKIMLKTDLSTQAVNTKETFQRAHALALRLQEDSEILVNKLDMHD